VQIQGQILGQEESGAWVYVLPDHLGSVRQLADAEGQVALAQSYDPFGVPFEASGSGASDFGYTGEWYGSYNDLLFLRARYYDPAVGRFLSTDPWPGSPERPLTLNGWDYVQDNPVNQTDPSGYHSIAFGMCFGLVFARDVPFMTVGQAIAICQTAYDQASWTRIDGTDCSRRRGAQWSTPQTVDDLFEDWLCERGPEHVHFSGADSLTRALARSGVLHNIREKFYQGGENPIPEVAYRFNAAEFLYATDDIARGELGVSHFLGTFDYSVSLSILGRVIFRVHNQTDRASGSHFRGLFEEEGYINSLEELVDDNPQLAKEPLGKVVNPNSGYYVISVLRGQNREETSGSVGGGVMEQTFTWSERRLICPEETLSNWPAYLDLLDIGEWPVGDLIPTIHGS
jgi:RHS repeat-associated protein